MVSDEVKGGKVIMSHGHLRTILPNLPTYIITKNHNDSESLIQPIGGENGVGGGNFKS